MKSIAERLLAVVVLVTGVHQVPAAEFRKSSLEAGKLDLIEVIGDLAIDDEKKFIQLALGTDDAIVAFHSPGGNLFAGIEIGTAIRLKGFSTYVPDGLLCASACSLAWLGGRSRLMSDTAKVGFHAAYTDQRGQNNVSAPGNALVGAYLNQLGLPRSAIVYITHSAPDRMQWLNFSDAQRFGIEVKKFNLANRTPAAPPTMGPSMMSPRSLWEHNGSVLYLAANGAGRRFYYDTPREGLDSVGVKRGTLLFDGQKNGDQYSGTAYFFSKICGPGTYAVSGPVTSNQSQITITLSGKAPRLDANCKQIGLRDDVLVFTYKASAPN